MKPVKLVAAVPLMLMVLTCTAQTEETQIRNLENLEHKAMMAQDTAKLSTILAMDILVTTPANKIIYGRDNVFAMKKAGPKFLSFEREVEQVAIKGDIAISVGHETVVTLDNSNAKSISNRRFTNIWIKQNGTWKLTARHTNEICKP